MINKKNVLEQLIVVIKTDIEKLRKSFESAKQASIDSPGRMQSRYDTMGIESAWVADGLAKSLNEKESNLTSLENFKFIESSERVCLGSILGISSSDSPTLEYFFILPVFGGYELQEKDITITTITPETPFGKVLIGGQIGKKIEISFPTRRTITIEKLI